MLNWCLYLNCYRINHIINNLKQKVKESQTNFEKKETFPVSLVKCIMSCYKISGAPAKNRTWISGFGGLRHIHWTTGANYVTAIMIIAYGVLKCKPLLCRAMVSLIRQVV